MKKSQGFIIGKFMPPHAGHLYLFDKALGHVDNLTVMVFWNDAEPIPGAQRLAWLRALRPHIRFIECTDRHAVDYNDPALWDLWVASIRKHYAHRPDIVFASETYGAELARRLDAAFHCVDEDRTAVPVSASDIRTASWHHWHHIPDIVKPHFVQRVCIIGGESTGKTTLAKDLGDYFGTNNVPEYAREFLAANNNTCTPSDMNLIAAEQVAREDKAGQSAGRFLFCDTNAIVTKLWSLHYFKHCSPEVESLVETRPYSFYLVTKPDIPWVDDGMRDTPGDREWFFEHSLTELERIGAPYGIVTGSGPERLACAAACIKERFGV